MHCFTCVFSTSLGIEIKCLTLLYLPQSLKWCQVGNLPVRSYWPHIVSLPLILRPSSVSLRELGSQLSHQGAVLGTQAHLSVKGLVKSSQMIQPSYLHIWKLSKPQEEVTISSGGQGSIHSAFSKIILVPPSLQQNLPEMLLTRGGLFLPIQMNSHSEENSKAPFPSPPLYTHHSISGSFLYPALQMCGICFPLMSWRITNPSNPGDIEHDLLCTCYFQCQIHEGCTTLKL